MSNWFVYIVKCADGSLYTGITTDIQRRLDEHNGDGVREGARYTRPRRPVSLVFCEAQETRSGATYRELEIKRLTRDDKLNLIRRNTL